MFELILEHTSDRIRIRLLADDMQKQECEFGFTYEVSEQERDLIAWYLERYLLFPYGPFQSRAAEAEAATEAMGERLFAAIFTERSAQALYRQVADDLSNCRIVVEANGPEGWELPWELLRDPVRQLWLALAAGAFVRRHPQRRRKTIPAPVDLSTLNVLLVICRPLGVHDVPFRSLARPLMEVFRPYRERINLHILRPPTFAALSDTLLDRSNFYHIVHFNGHGTLRTEPSEPVDPRSGQGWLVFESEDGERPHYVSGDQFGELLTRAGVPIVLLDACHSGAMPPKAAFGSVAQQLLEAGVPAVVAMNYAILHTTAAQFMTEVYTALINGEPLGRAVTAARRRLCSNPDRQTAYGEVPLRDWIVPVLFEAVPVRLAQPAKDKLLLGDIQLGGHLAITEVEVDMPPPPQHGFIGRDWELLQLERAFETKTIVLLQGFAGTGKTAIAVAFARWWAETGGLDGPAFFFSFENHLPPNRVCNRVGEMFGDVLRAQGIEWQALDDIQRREVALQILRQVPCLLIWDHFEPVAGFPPGTRSIWTDEEQQELMGFLRDLRGGATKVIITSRRGEAWLGNICYRMSIDGLDYREAREFASAILARRDVRLPKPQFDSVDRDPYQRLLTYLRGNPLALQLIVPELTRSDPLAVLQELQALETHLPDDGESEGRTPSLSATVGYGFDQLDLAVRRRLSLLALFHVSVSPQVLETMCQGASMPAELQARDTAAWQTDLDAAAHIGLLHRHDRDIYEIHPALPWVFQTNLQRHYEDTIPVLVDAYTDAYGVLAETSFQQFPISPEHVIAILRLEEANLHHALQLARTRQRWQAAQGILYGLRTLLTTLGRWADWESIAEEVKAEISDPAGEPLTGRERLWNAVQGHLAEIAMFYGRLDTSEAIYQHLGAYYETQGEQRNAAVAVHQLGRIAQERRRFDEARTSYQKSLEIAEMLGDLRLTTTTLHSLGTIAQETAELDKAEVWYRRGLEISERSNDQYAIGSALHQLGTIAQERGRLEEARAWYQQSLEIAQRSGNQRGIATALHQLGIICQERGELDTAEDYFRCSLEIAEQLGDQHGIAATLHNLGVVAQMQGRFSEAEEWYRRSLTIKEQLGNETGVARALHQLGRTAQQQEQFDEAEAWYFQSLELAQRLGEQRGIASTLHQLGIIAQERGELDTAEAYFRRSLQIEERIGDERGMASTLHQLGIIAQKRGQLDEAEGQYRQSLSITEQVGDRQGQAITIVQLANVALTEQRRNEAEVLLRRAEALFADLNNQPAVDFVRHELLQFHPVPAKEML
jgi:tetratricopeptide (TPR) repeat protein